MIKRVLISAALLATMALGSPVDASARGSVVEFVNAERVERGLAPLRASRSLSRSARRYGGHLMRRDVIRHPRRLWISASRFRLRGETLALHRPWAPRRETVTMWMRSPSHRALLLHKSMRLMGAGQARGRFNGRPATIRVLHLGRR